jgi:glucosamine--fructose-6-phosphate aminotransferase (isomerizing)
MCGIFGYIGPQQNAGQTILEGLKRLEYRGYDSWGVAVKKTDGETYIEKRVGKIGDAQLPEFEATIGIGHTRWATHGGVTEQNAHPHANEDRSVVVVHNGIVENYLEIKEALLDADFSFQSETDTEVIANLVSHELRSRNNDPFEAVRNAFLKLEGRNAIVVLLPEHNLIFVAKNGSPVAIGFGDKEFFLSSDAAALLPHTRDVLFLKDDHMVKMTYDDVTLYSISEGNEVSYETQTLDWDIEAAEKGQYDHFLMKEIMEQDKVILNAAAQRPELVQELVNLMKASYGTYFVASGTAAHACRMATYIFSIIAKRHVNFCIGSEFLYQEHFLTEKSLLIAASQSGETADTLDAIAAARTHGAHIAALVNALGSTMSREADITMPLNAGPEIAVLSTKAYVAKITIMFLLAYTMNNEYEKGRQELEKTAEAAKGVLYDEEMKAQLERIAEKICSQSDIYLLGRGISYPLALEGGHKIKEASYIHAEGFAGGEPKHCEISLVSPGTPAIIFVPNDETKAAILSNAIEYKARGAYIIGIGPQKHDVFDEFIQMPDVGITSSIIHIMPVQILSYYLALKRGTDPDKPRNLAKSVTVK